MSKGVVQNRIRAGLAATALAIAFVPLAGMTPAEAREQQAPDRQRILDAMKRATKFMVEDVSTHGGYVWSYLPDMSRRWGELEARPSMIWVQPPGTPDMGNLFLDAYHATGDEYYYEAAKKAADALIAGEIATGGWNYFIDFAGEASTRQFYDTVGKNAWRMEEFQHYWGNATFDDDGTAQAMKFILRLYAEKFDPKYKSEVMRNIDFVLESQYPNGGWPQRWPLKHEFVHHGLADYTSYITFNDNVTAENVDYLIDCYQVLSDQRLLPAIYRGMDIYLLTQQGQPQPGWALQYTPVKLEPAAARSYEPKALATHTTASAVEQLMRFYRLTGDSRYLARIPEALDWLESVKLPPDQASPKGAYPTFIEIGTGKPLYLHRRGSNAANGEYYTSSEPDHVIGHYSSYRNIDVAALRREYERMRAMPPEEARSESPLFHAQAGAFPRFVETDTSGTSDLNDDMSARNTQAIVAGLNAQGYWPTELKATSNPYIGDPSDAPADKDYETTRVGDRYDTSPYYADKPVIGISTAAYLNNMGKLISALERQGG
ncbi:pectate lyase [Stakelama saccharophila]|uniref:Pectate lyase n=1 Tax=Stakelama saccharophila TaxID=3075605 RepID=A0ABZ0BBZ2_9SPHN|nr:pectate lyase [Stakelama sp. W311]WNO54814.1 pectate lyase [Stakelama sp. W311]